MDTFFQIRIRTYDAHRRWEWALADLLEDTPRRVRSIQLLSTPIWGYPTPQLVLTYADAPPAHMAVPVDARGWNLPVCTVDLAPGESWTGISAALHLARPDTHHCTGTGERFEVALRSGLLRVFAATGPTQDPLPEQLGTLQFLCPSDRPPTPPRPAPDEEDAVDGAHTGAPVEGTLTLESALQPLPAAATTPHNLELQADQPLRRSNWVRGIVEPDCATLIPVTVFDPIRHQTTFSQQADVTLAQTVHKILREAPCTVAFVRFPAIPVRDLPGLQVVLTPAGYPEPFRAVPVDGRPLFNAISVIMLEPNATAKEALQAIDGVCRWETSTLTAYEQGTVTLRAAYSLDFCQAEPNDASPLCIASTTAQPSKGPLAGLPTPQGRRRLAPAPTSGASSCKQTICLIDCLPDPEPGLWLGTVPGMLDTLLEGHHIAALHTSLPPLLRLTQDMSEAWEALPVWCPDQPIEAVFFFTDGSWNPDRQLAAWAFLCIVRQGDVACKVGCASGLCVCDDNPRPITEAQLAQPEAANAIAAAFQSLPPIAWEIDATTHVSLVQRHLQDTLRQLLPDPQPKARHPALGNRTLELIKSKRAIRSRMRSLQSRARAVTRQRFIHRWTIAAQLRQGPPPSLPTWPIRRRWLHWWCVLRRTDRDLTTALQKDKAAYVRRMYQTAREDGAADFAHLIRSILRTGRKFKVPSLIPVLDKDQETPVRGKKEVLQTFALHFGSAERARPITVNSCLARAGRMQPLPRPLSATNLPTLARLCRAFASFTSKKAPGLSGLSTTIFKTAPHQAALAYMPIACKAIIKGTTPLQWSGGRAAPIPKPGKSPGALSGWRSILLLESDAKALQKAMRDSLVTAMERGRADGQHGGLPGHTLAMPAAAVRAHFLHLHNSGGSGGAIFVDSASAYYAVVRDFLAIPAPENLPEEELRRRARALYADPDQQMAYAAAMRSGNLLEALQAPEETCRFVAAQLKDTWFVTEQGQDVMRAESGTAPGSPIADALFGIIYAKVLHRIHGQFGEAGLTATVSYEGQWAQAGEPTCADDSLRIS